MEKHFILGKARGIEALTNKLAHKYIAIGGLWITADHREAIKTGLSAIKEKYSIKGEFKWNKLSPADYDYSDLQFI